PVGRQHAGERMDEDALHAERVGDSARVLPARPAEAGERVTCDVMASCDRNLPNSRSHVVHGNLEESFGDLLQSLSADRIGDFLEPRSRSLAVERLVAGPPEYVREMIGIDPAQKQVAVGDGE